MKIILLFCLLMTNILFADTSSSATSNLGNRPLLTQNPSVNKKVDYYTKPLITIAYDTSGLYRFYSDKSNPDLSTQGTLKPGFSYGIEQNFLMPHNSISWEKTYMGIGVLFGTEREETGYANPSLKFSLSEIYLNSTLLWGENIFLISHLSYIFPTIKNLDTQYKVSSGGELFGVHPAIFLGIAQKDLMIKVGVKIYEIKASDGTNEFSFYTFGLIYEACFAL